MKFHWSFSPKKDRWRIRRILFDLLRPFVVRDAYADEDFMCMECSKPVLGRTLYCSPRCRWRMENLTENDRAMEEILKKRGDRVEP